LRDLTGLTYNYFHLIAENGKAFGIILQ